MKIGKIARVGRAGRMWRTKVISPAGAEGPLTGGGVRQLDLMPEALRVMARRVGDKRARRVWKLMERGIQGTLPELLTYDWLERQKVGFQFQSGQMGGRRTSGGAVVDVSVDGLEADGLYIWRVQGEYWHKGPEVERKDWMQKARLLRLKIGGVPVVEVVDLWENDVYDRYPEVFRRAEMGMGLRG
jgi:hypothetical protein